MLDKYGKELHVGDKVKVLLYHKAYIMEFRQDNSGDEVAYVDVVRKTKKGYKTRWNGTCYPDEIKKMDWK